MVLCFCISTNNNDDQLLFTGEAGVPFFQASGAEFDEVYVGTGAKRVRQLFQVSAASPPHQGENR